MRPDRMEKYKKSGNIGHGSFGRVYKGFNLETIEAVAFKEIHFLEELDDVPSSVIREISLLREMEHRNIIRLLDVVSNIEHERNIVWLVFEHLDVDLKMFMGTHSEMAKIPRVIKRFLHQILSALAYCHSHNIVHRDLRPQNLFIDFSNCILKLVFNLLPKEFESAGVVGVPHNSFAQGEEVAAALLYKAPELLLGPQTNYSTPADVWSVGCIFAEMWNHQPLFDGSRETELAVNIFRLLGTPREEIWRGITLLTGRIGKDNPEGVQNLAEVALQNLPKVSLQNLAKVVPDLEPAGVDLLSKMLCVNPRERITACDALKHPYFVDVVDFDRP